MMELKPVTVAGGCGGEGTKSGDRRLSVAARRVLEDKQGFQGGTGTTAQGTFSFSALQWPILSPGKTRQAEAGVICPVQRRARNWWLGVFGGEASLVCSGVTNARWE